MKIGRKLWFGSILGLLTVSIGRTQDGQEGLVLALIGISVVMIGMSIVAEWYAERGKA